jgi:hypothetical protein
MLHISKQAPYVLVLSSVAFYRISFQKPSSNSPAHKQPSQDRSLELGKEPLEQGPIVVTACKRTPMQDVIGVYMSTKKNSKCMTLLMIKDEYKSRVGQLAEAAAARVLRREVRTGIANCILLYV